MMRGAWTYLVMGVAIAGLMLSGCSSDSGSGDGPDGGNGDLDSGNAGPDGSGGGPDGGLDAGGDGGGNGGPTDGGRADSPFQTSDAGRVLCGQDPCECDNGIDDDMDGPIDGLDPECTGPKDDDEDSFATGIPGDNMDQGFEDCFFDGNSGTEDDGCQYHRNCLLCGDNQEEWDTCDDAQMAANCQNMDCCDVGQDCVDFCQVRSPNGCDCFGCCEVQLGDGGTTTVALDTNDTGCSFENLEGCPTCEQDDECVNDCGTCELCLGKTREDLPESCFSTGGGDGGVSDGGTTDGGGGGVTCDNGTPCTSESDCGEFEYCQTGCCTPVVI